MKKTPAQLFPEWFAETDGPNAWAYMWRGRFAEIYHEWASLQAETKVLLEGMRRIADERDQLLGIGSEREFAEITLELVAAERSRASAPSQD